VNHKAATGRSSLAHPAEPVVVLLLRHTRASPEFSSGASSSRCWRLRCRLAAREAAAAIERVEAGAANKLDGGRPKNQLWHNMLSTEVASSSALPLDKVFLVPGDALPLLASVVQVTLCDLYKHSDYYDASRSKLNPTMVKIRATQRITGSTCRSRLALRSPADNYACLSITAYCTIE
jgi:hypothetical protein